VRGSRLRKAHALIAALIHLRMGFVHGAHGGRGGLVCFLLSGRSLGEGTGDANATNRDGENYLSHDCFPLFWIAASQ
jgi:hypothetical protein